ncbi:hypothetical protein NQZ68_025421 [Dissostichus eleginoides]|nr:hypothetical protein NQZ68_025409 [Dissostichus eleginoides]KAI9523699.1 hypothetical protein NQZ68_025421 [Dissostichus eleginoides]
MNSRGGRLFIAPPPLVFIGMTFQRRLKMEKVIPTTLMMAPLGVVFRGTGPPTGPLRPSMQGLRAICHHAISSCIISGAISSETLAAAISRAISAELLKG